MHYSTYTYGFLILLFCSIHATALADFSTLECKGVNDAENRLTLHVQNKRMKRMRQLKRTLELSFDRFNDDQTFMVYATQATDVGMEIALPTLNWEPFHEPKRFMNMNLEMGERFVMNDVPQKKVVKYNCRLVPSLSPHF
ncbi:MAG: hypothetical protein KA715_00375 [Xanthomonadaceae bacterium]|nr:hypothetical protein [Xanthomonadaceae bacterium]